MGRTRWIGAGLLLAGVVGVTMAITAVLAALPAPAAGGTCGPGHGSEGALFAFFDPASIGAGSPPPATASAATHLQWLAFVSECQSSANAHMLSGFFALVLGLAAVAGGFALLRRTPLWRSDPGSTGDERPASGPSSPSDSWSVRATWSPGRPVADPPSAVAPEDPPPRDLPVGVTPG
jgi:hypothetical protein